MRSLRWLKNRYPGASHSKGTGHRRRLAVEPLEARRLLAADSFFDVFVEIDLPGLLDAGEVGPLTPGAESPGQNAADSLFEAWPSNLEDAAQQLGPDGPMPQTDAEIVTGPGPGDVYGPHVRGLNGGTPGGGSNYAYGTLKWGVNVTS